MRTTTHPSSPARHHRGFTAIELMIAIGIMAATAGMTIPMFRQYQTQADIDTATEHLVQALRAAQSLSQSGKADSSWGVYFPDGVLFSGDEYAVRSEERDAVFGVPPSVDTSGLDETSFTKIDGLPTQTGIVYITSSISGGYRTITIDQNGVIVVSGIKEGEGTTGGTTGGDTGGDTGGTTGGDTGGTTGGTTGGDTGGTTGNTGGDTGGTTGGTTGGDTGGTTGGGSSSSVSSSSSSDSSVSSSSSSFSSSSVGDTGGGSSSSVSSSSSSDNSVSSSSSSSGGSGGSERCGVKSFSVHGSSCAITGQYSSVTYECYDGAEKEVENDTCRTSADWMAKANAFCEGRCSGNSSCDKRFSIDDDQGTIRSIGTNDVKFTVLGSDSTYGSSNNKIDVRFSVSDDDGDTWSDLFGGKSIRGEEQETLANIPSVHPIKIRVNGRYSWIFNKTFRSDGKDGHIIALKNGDPLPNYVQLRNVASLPQFFKRVVDAQGKVSIGPKDVLYLVELNALDNSARFQSAVILASFAPKANTCADKSKPAFKVSFKRIENTGKGDMRNQIFVGPGKVAYAEEQWIPLEDSLGNAIIDGSLVKDVRGFAVERGDHWVRILNHGSHANSSGKEIVDARILFNHAWIVSMQNDINDAASENPYDDIVNDTAAGDEFVAGPNTKSMTFKTRVTASDDAVILNWLRDDVMVSGSSSSSSSLSSSSSSSSSVEGLGDSCYVPYTVNSSTKFIELGEKSDISVRIAGSEATYGKRGPKIAVRARITFDGGRTWQNINGGKSLRGNELVVYRDVAAGSKIAVEYSGRYSWTFNSTLKSTDGNDHVLVLKKGQTVNSLSLAKNGGTLKKFLNDITDDDARMKLTDRDVAILGDFTNDQNKSYNDAVTVISIDRAKSNGGCISSSSSSNSISSIAQSSSSVSSSVPDDADTDNDGVKNSDDWCPFDTTFPESVPTEYMSFDRYALTKPRGNPHSLPVFRTGPRNSVSDYSMEDMHGCSCSGVLDAIEGNGYSRFDEHPIVFRQLKNLFGYVISNSRKFGCSNSLMQMVKDAK